MYRTDFWTLWKARVGCFKRTASKHVYYLGWDRSPAQVGCMRQVLRPGALGRPRGIGWRGRWEWESGWGIHVNPWLILVNVWQKPLQYCKVISLQLIYKKNEHIVQHKEYSQYFITTLYGVDYIQNTQLWWCTPETDIINQQYINFKQWDEKGKKKLLGSHSQNQKKSS